MDIYRYFAENEKRRLTFYFTYEVHMDELRSRLEATWGQPVHIYDVFPHLNSESAILDEPLSVITESGKEMFLPAKFKVNFFDRVFILFGDINSDEIGE